MTEKTISDETDDLYAETAAAVGNVAIQWNSLCEVLGNIFVTLVANENRDRDTRLGTRLKVIDLRGR